MMRNVLITGANGFIGKNLQVALKELSCTITTFGHNDPISELKDKVIAADVIYHLGGVNRPVSETEFITGNTESTESLLALISEFNPQVTFVYTSSSQAEQDNAYGLSKLGAENLILEQVNNNNLNASIYRLPGVFGKWCRPNYNSVVATFCNNLIHGVPLKIENEEFNLKLVYIDDVIEVFKKHLDPEYKKDCQFCEVTIVYTITLGKLVEKLENFKNSRATLVTESVGCGLTRALYATYLSYLPPEAFSYSVPVYEDNRGIFSELIKTPGHGQFSFFTAKPGIVRGGHYHHTKNEKFIVVSGTALFQFENISTGETVELKVSSGDIRVVDTIPGWAHNIKNTGQEDLIVMLWANEIFDRNKPDTINWSM